EVGRAIPEPAARDLYADHLLKCSPSRLDGLSVVLDCAHGAAFEVAPRVFRELGARVHAIHCQPDGTNINVRCGSTHMEALQAEVVARGADMGLAFDGDADRCLAVDERGQVVDGDPMMAIFADWLQQQGRLANHLVVATVMSNVGLEVTLREQGVRLVRANVGDRYVLEGMKEHGAVLGGEQSGHIILLEHATTGDGTLAALMLARIVRETGQPLSALADRMPRFPQRLVNVPARYKERLDQDREIGAAIQRLEERLARRGRILVRPSGTEPLVRVMAEGPDLDELEQVVGELSRLIQQRLS
ncbi:MAG: phosphoglucosamine mutase, partial [Candidatus Eremiobacterota bacterium]